MSRWITSARQRSAASRASLAILIPLAFVLVTAGCGRKADLGQTATAGPFKVTLVTDPPKPTAAPTAFEVTVTRGDKPVPGAQVALTVSMTSMSMEDQAITLAPSDSHYTGTATLMAGDYDAKVSVTAGGGTGTASYHFTISQ